MILTHAIITSSTLYTPNTVTYTLHHPFYTPTIITLCHIYIIHSTFPQLSVSHISLHHPFYAPTIITVSHISLHHPFYAPTIITQCHITSSILCSHNHHTVSHIIIITSFTLHSITLSHILYSINYTVTYSTLLTTLITHCHYIIPVDV